MDEDSFDPRSWGKTTPPGPVPVNPPVIPAAVPGKPEPLAAKPASPASASDSPPLGTAAAGTRAARLPWLASAAVLLIAAAGAYAMRAPGTAVVAGEPAAGEPVAVVSAPPVDPAAVERKLNLTGAGEIAGALTANGVAPADAAAAASAASAVLTQPGEVRAVLTLMPVGAGFRLDRMQASYADGSGAVIARNEEGGFSGTKVGAELSKQVKVLRGELDSESFYSSAVAAGVVDTLIPEFINAFAFDFNIAADVHPGDTFEVAYEQSVNAQGEPFGQPQLLYASLTTPEKSRTLYRFQPPGAEAGWFDGNGGSIKRGLMRTPVDGARITSNFGMRFHPVLHYNRLHAGVDFGVPIGTPVYAAADGIVIGAHPTACGGNMAVVQHPNGWVTRYFHLSHFAPGLVEGEHVTQGFTLGLSGTTGTCTTGPHLHYELRIKDEPVDPMSMPMDDNQKKRLEGAALQAFVTQRNRIDVARAKQAI